MCSVLLVKEKTFTSLQETAFLNISHSLVCFREGSSHHYEGAIMGCCLAQGPLMKESFSSCAPLRETQPCFSHRIQRYLDFWLGVDG